MSLVHGDDPESSSLIFGLKRSIGVPQTSISKVYDYIEPVGDETGKYKCKL